MSDKLPFFAAESGTWKTTSPNPHIDLSGTALTLGTYPAQTFAQAAADTTVDFATTNTCTIVAWVDATHWARYEGAVWTDASPDVLDLSAATLMGVGPAGGPANDETVSVVASLPMITAANIGAVNTANTPNANEFARFTDADTIEGRTYAEVRADLDLEPGVDFLALRASHIDGAYITVTGNAAISVSAGAVALESGGVLVWTSPLTATGLTVSASTWYHLYVYSSTGTPTLDFSTTAPAAPYSGTARSKTGQSGYRYIGSLNSDASGFLYRISHAGDSVMYLATYYAEPFRVLSSGSATSYTDVDCSAVIPATTQRALIMAQNSAGSQALFLSDSDSGMDLQTVGYVSGGTIGLYREFPLDSGQRMSYKYVSSGGVGYVDIIGYRISR